MENDEKFCSLCLTKKDMEYDCRNCELYNAIDGTYVNGSGRYVDSGPYKTLASDSNERFYLCRH